MIKILKFNSGVRSPGYSVEMKIQTTKWYYNISSKTVMEISILILKLKINNASLQWQWMQEQYKILKVLGNAADASCIIVYYVKIDNLDGWSSIWREERRKERKIERREEKMST